MSTITINLRSLLDNPYYVNVDVSGTGTNSGELFPGQPLTLQWGVYSYIAAVSGPSEVPAYAAGRATISFNGVVVWGPSPQRSVTISASSLGRAFYRVGQVNQLIITIDAQGAQELTTMAEITIIADADPTWTWSPVPAMLLWKSSAYSISGAVASSSDYAQLTVQPTLHEEATDISVSRDLGSSSGGSFTLAPRAVATIPFGPISQIWHWVDEVSIYLAGPTSQDFQYTARLSVNDEYGNVFGGPGGTIASSTLDVVVNVSQEKRNAQLAAAASQLLAIGATVAAGIFAAGFWTSPAAAVALGIAATLEAAARAGLAAALDPPGPDPNFAQDVPMPVLGKVSDVPQDAMPLATFASAARHLIETRNAMSVVEGRIWGARNAGNEALLQKQQTAYMTMLAAMRDDLNTLVQRGGAELPSSMKADPAKVQSETAVLGKGFPDDLQQQFTKFGLSKADLAAFEKSFAVPDVPNKVVDALAVFPQTLNAIVNQLGGVVFSVTASAQAVLHRGKAF